MTAISKLILDDNLDIYVTELDTEHVLICKSKIITGCDYDSDQRHELSEESKPLFRGNTLATH